MNRVPCPHCGFMNFSISAYCGRCERPLPRPGDTAVAVPAPIVLGAVPAEPADAGDGPTVVDVAPRAPARPAARPAKARPEVMAPTPTPIAIAEAMAETAVPPPARVLAASPLASVPPPLPPLSLDAPPPSVQPLELDAKARRPRRAPGPDIGDVLPDPDAEVPVTVPGGLRLLVARLVDAGVVAAFGALVVFVQAMITGASFTTPSSGALDTIAEWLSTNRELITRSVVVTGAFAVGYSVAAALRTGQTLGRKLTNTVLVRRSGQPFTVPLLVVRAVVSVVSALLLGAGFFWAIVDPYHRTWHDLVAGTVTVSRYVHVPERRRA